MFQRFCDLITRIADAALAAGFFALIVTVSYQVLGRTLFGIPAIWTLDLAQLLFTWLIFIGAAVALRRNMHYVVDVLPEHWVQVSRALAVLSILAAILIVYVLVVAGGNLASLRATAVSPSLRISMFWTFLAFPASGLLMALYVIEQILTLNRPPQPPEEPRE